MGAGEPNPLTLTTGHANLGASLWSVGSNCPRSTGVPNLKSVAN